MGKAFQRQLREETYVDEVHAGANLSTVHALQDWRDALKLQASSIKPEWDEAKRQARDTRRVKRIMDDLVSTSKWVPKEGQDAFHQAQAERDKAQAVHHQLMSESVQTSADQGMALLEQQLSKAKEEVEHLKILGATPQMVSCNATLQAELQKACEEVNTLKATSPDTTM